MEFGYCMSFSDPKYPNPNRTRYGPENYEYFTGILIIDSNRSGPEKNRLELEPKICKYLLDPNV